MQSSGLQRLQLSKTHSICVYLHETCSSLIHISADWEGDLQTLSLIENLHSKEIRWYKVCSFAIKYFSKEFMKVKWYLINQLIITIKIGNSILRLLPSPQELLFSSFSVISNKFLTRYLQLNVLIFFNYGLKYLPGLLDLLMQVCWHEMKCFLPLLCLSR